MNPMTIIALLAILVYSAYGAGDGPSFCYRDEDGCGPGTSLWSPLCHNGQRQSPIDLPVNLRSSGLTRLRMVGAYRGDFFRLQNSGHSINIDFVGESGEAEGPSANTFTFYDPLDRRIRRDYKFASVHFHWGLKDDVGSEHSVGSKSFSMEAHFVHIHTNYSTMEEAKASGDENALAVLGVFINGEDSANAEGPLAPVVKHLEEVKLAMPHDSYVRVEEEIDFTNLIVTENPAQVYSYKGSLTTPGCNELVNWYVIRKPTSISRSDLESFRTKLIDGNGRVLDENHRPIQERNGRKVLLHTTVATH